MASDPILIYVKASAVANVLTTLPKDWPGWRELDIQNAKLMRMIGDFIKRNELKVGTSPLTSFRKSYGEGVRKLCEQEKKVQSLLNKLMEEHAVRNNQSTRKGFRKNLQRFSATFDKMIYEAKKGYLKQLSGMVNEEGKKLKS
jgi:hypothetical protein